jgi:hypothetical protein
MSQLRWIAAALFTKVAPLTSKGRSELPELVTGGAAPPRVPVNVCKFAVELVDEAATLPALFLPFFPAVVVTLVAAPPVTAALNALAI